MSTSYTTFSTFSILTNPLCRYDRRPPKAEPGPEDRFSFLQEPATYGAIAFDAVAIGSAFVFGGLPVAAITFVALASIVALSIYGKQWSNINYLIWNNQLAERSFAITTIEIGPNNYTWNRKVRDEGLEEVGSEMLKELLNNLNIGLKQTIGGWVFIDISKSKETGRDVECHLYQNKKVPRLKRNVEITAYQYAQRIGLAPFECYSVRLDFGHLRVGS